MKGYFQFLILFFVNFLNLYKNLIKPIADTVVAAILLVLFFPIFLLLSSILLFANRGKIFFIQRRPGYKGRLFSIYKFKTMLDLFDEAGSPLPDHMRITPVGRVIRSLSLDEVLQLVNVIKGDLSLVGPRPLLVQYLDRYSPEQARRHDVKPGITGWAQVNGRNAISWEEKFRFDVEYVERQSFCLDFRILLLTVVKVVKRNGISAEGRVTIDEFGITKTQSKENV